MSQTVTLGYNNSHIQLILDAETLTVVYIFCTSLLWQTSHFSLLLSLLASELFRAEQSSSLLPAISQHGHSWYRAPLEPMAIYLFNGKILFLFSFFVVPPLTKREGLYFFFIIGVPLLLNSAHECTLFHICLTYRLGNTESNTSSLRCQEKGVYNCHLDSDIFTALIVAETCLSSRCLAMDTRSDFDISTFSRQVTICTKDKIPMALGTYLVLENKHVVFIMKFHWKVSLSFVLTNYRKMNFG
jgi:hypothetical protein